MLAEQRAHAALSSKLNRRLAGPASASVGNVFRLCSPKDPLNDRTPVRCGSPLHAHQAPTDPAMAKHDHGPTCRQTMRVARLDVDRDKIADPRITRMEVHRLLPRRAPDELAMVLPARSRSTSIRRPRAAALKAAACAFQASLEALEALRLDLFRNVAPQPRRRRAGSGAVLKRVSLREPDIVNEFQRRLEILFRFARETDDEVG